VFEVIRRGKVVVRNFTICVHRRGKSSTLSFEAKALRALKNLNEEQA